MKELLIVLLLFHGIIHLLGYAKASNLKEFDQFSTVVPKPYGLLWLLVSALFIFSTLGFLLSNNFGIYTTLIAIALSQILIIKFWVDAKAGSIVNAMLLLVLLFTFGLK